MTFKIYLHRNLRNSDPLSVGKNISYENCISLWAWLEHHVPSTTFSVFGGEVHLLYILISIIMIILNVSSLLFCSFIFSSSSPLGGHFPLYYFCWVQVCFFTPHSNASTCAQLSTAQAHTTVHAPNSIFQITHLWLHMKLMLLTGKLICTNWLSFSPGCCCLPNTHMCVH